MQDQLELHDKSAWSVALPQVVWGTQHVPKNWVARIGKGGNCNGDEYDDILVEVTSPQRLDGPTSGCVGSAAVISGKDGTVLLSFIGNETAWVRSASLGADFNADGISDYLLAWIEHLPGKEATSFVSAESGADGQRLARLQPMAGGETDDVTRLLFGTCFGVIGDVDGDGVADVYVTDPGSPVLVGHSAEPSGVARKARKALTIFSGREWMPLVQIDSPWHERGFGTTAAPVDDLDGDGASDIAIGAVPFAWTPLADSVGAVIVISGSQGTVIRTWEGDRHESWLGSELANIGDADADGHADLVVGQQDAPPLLADVLRVMSSKSGAVLRELVYADLPPSGSWDQRSLAGDLDGDGVSELLLYPGYCYEAVAPNEIDAREFQVYVVNVLTGRVMGTMRSTNNAKCWGCAVAGLGDLDKDGRQELGVIDDLHLEGDSVVVQVRVVGLE